MPSKAITVLTGHAGGNAEFKDVGTGLTTFRLANSHREKLQSGEYETMTDWYTVKVWGSYGQKLVGKILKGDNVQVHGEQVFEYWTAKDGTDRMTVVIKADYFGVMNNTKREQGPPAAKVQDSSDLPF